MSLRTSVEPRIYAGSDGTNEDVIFQVVAPFQGDLNDETQVSDNTTTPIRAQPHCEELVEFGNLS